MFVLKRAVYRIVNHICSFLQMSVIFVDMEGTPVGEVSAIQMNLVTRQIVDVYHNHADMHGYDEWCQRHYHGLNPLFLERFGLGSEHELLNDFKEWLRGKEIFAMYANNPGKEKAALGRTIYDIELPRWSERKKRPSHIMAKAFKKIGVPILNKRCPPEAHSSYRYFPVNCWTNETELAKHDFGYHCALYDTYELFLTYVSDV